MTKTGSEVGQSFSMAGTMASASTFDGTKEIGRLNHHAHRLVISAFEHEELRG